MLIVGSTDQEIGATIRENSAIAPLIAIGGFTRAAVGMGIAMGIPWVWVWGEYEDDLPSPQTHGNSMGIFNQPEITR